MTRIVVYHSSYGCETGCCGHAIFIDPTDSIMWSDERETFNFSHPYGQDHLAYAKGLVAQELGVEHVADLDWENCVISDD